MPEELNLLPCPVCNGAAKFWAVLGGVTTSIKCTTCGLGIGEVFCIDCDNPQQEMLARAAELWNALPRALTWAKEPPTPPGTYCIIYKDKTVDTIHYFKLPSEEEVDGVAYWLGPLPSVFGIICDMDKEPTP